MATEKRLIDARYLTSQMYLICEACQTENIFIDAIIDEIDNAPDVDAVEVVYGRWVGYHEADIGYDEYGVRCSNCNFEVEDHEVDFIMNYCPNCGAKMDGDRNG